MVSSASRRSRAPSRNTSASTKTTRTANQVVRLRQEGERLAQNQLAAGVVLVSERRQATAATYKAEADSLQTSLGYLLAWAELEQAVGRTPGF